MEASQICISPTDALKEKKEEDQANCVVRKRQKEKALVNSHPKKTSIFSELFFCFFPSKHFITEFIRGVCLII